MQNGGGKGRGGVLTEQSGRYELSLRRRSRAIGRQWQAVVVLRCWPSCWPAEGLLSQSVTKRRQTA